MNEENIARADLLHELEQIRGINASYERLTACVGEIIFRMRADNGQIIYINSAAEKILGYPHEFWLNNPNLAAKIIHPDSVEIYEKILAQMNQGIDIIKGLTLKLVAWDGYEVIFSYTSMAVKNERGIILYYETIIRDITIRNKLEDALRQSENLYRMVVEDQTELICRFKKYGILTFVNEAFCRYFGLSKGQLIGTRFIPRIPEEDRHKFKNCFRTISIDNPVVKIEQRIKMSDGEIRWQQWNYRAIFNEKNQIIEYQVVGRDITESKLLQKKLHYLGMHDAMTGLYNRAYFDEEMMLLDKSRYLPVGVIVADIDCLKMVNDNLGHQCGDELIKAAAIVLKGCFREGDVVARIGGDEFAVLLTETSKEVLEHSCQRIVKTCGEYRASHTHLPLSIAVGFALKLHPDQPMQKVFAEADNKMYTYKSNNRGATLAMIKDILKTG
ncbi:MAG: diguanylate cyclase [Syntrophomonas sp.]|nr:diguanylate cyclase [Syntrophomonas sp.]